MSASTPVSPSTIDSAGRRRAARRSACAHARGLHHGQAPALGRGRGQGEPRRAEQRAPSRPRRRGRGSTTRSSSPRSAISRLERLAVVAVARDVERRVRDRGSSDVEQQLDALVALEPPEVERARGLGARSRGRSGWAGRSRRRGTRRGCARGRSRARRAPRASLARSSGPGRRDRGSAAGRARAANAATRPTTAELRDVVVLVDVVDERDARRAQPAPERREERDAVDDLEHDVGVAAEPAQRRPRRAREDGEPRAHPVDRQALVRPGDPLGARVVPAMTVTRCPAAIQRDTWPYRIGPGAAGLRDGSSRDPRGSGCGLPGVMRARRYHRASCRPGPASPRSSRSCSCSPRRPRRSPRAAAEGRATRSTRTRSAPRRRPSRRSPRPRSRSPRSSRPGPRRRPRRARPRARRPRPRRRRQAPAAAAPQTQAAPAQTLPRTGFDVLPVAAVGLVLLLGGLALWRRPHADR